MIRFLFAAVLVSVLSVGTQVHAQGYPNRTIKLVVPFPAGGATDNAARLVAQRLQSSLGQSVIIENQGGAGGTIGTRQAAAAAPDGYTLLMASISTFGSMPLLYRLDFDPQRTFAPVATVVIEKGALVVRPSLPVKTIDEFVAYAKAHPGKLTYGSAIGIGPHFVAELFKIKSGTDIVHLPIAAARRWWPTSSPARST
jgi:tripartite-type tricarboxylate transporter receptor subunit TctC